MGVIRLVSWNMAGRRRAWTELEGRVADVALLQEARNPGAERPHVSATHDVLDIFETALLAGRASWGTAVMRLADRVELRPRASVTLEASTPSDDWLVSRTGSIAAADIVTDGSAAFTAVSVYAAWESVAGRGLRPRLRVVNLTPGGGAG